MVDAVNSILNVKEGEVNINERNLISVAYKNFISSKRTAYRTICTISDNPKHSKFSETLKAYRDVLEEQIRSSCMRIIDTVNFCALSKSCSDEVRAFFIKMTGDFYRYIAENSRDEVL